MVKKLTKKEASRQALVQLGVEPLKSWSIAKTEGRRKGELSRIKSICINALEIAEKYKRCYFWTNTGNASQRRRQEFDASSAFTFEGKRIEVRQYLQISCKNFYFFSDISRDGKKSNITILKGILGKIS